MKVEISIDEEAIRNIIKFIKDNPDEIRGLMQYIGEEALDILMTRRVLKKGAELYRRLNGEINFSYKAEDK